MSVVAVIPSRGRPERARQAIAEMRDTAQLVSTRIVLGVDYDDPRIGDYAAAVRFAGYGPEVTMVILGPGEGGSLTEATNTISMRIAHADPEDIIGNIGDDQIARTPGWDRLVADAMTEPSFIYGDDLFQREALPCGGMFIHGSIVEALGYYALPVCEHLFIDNAWRDLGLGTGRLIYLPEVVFEHVHPLAGKADWDEGYERANNQEVIDRDRTAYESWRDTWLELDVQRIREAMNIRTGRSTRYAQRSA